MVIWCASVSWWRPVSLSLPSLIDHRPMYLGTAPNNLIIKIKLAACTATKANSLYSFHMKISRGPLPDSTLPPNLTSLILTNNLLIINTLSLPYNNYLFFSYYNTTNTYSSTPPNSIGHNHQSWTAMDPRLYTNQLKKNQG